MRLKELGHTGEKIPGIGIGTWNLGKNVAEEVKAMKEGLGLGMRFMDTAELYNTEDIVGKALKGEKDVFIATKVSPHHFRHDDMIKACDRSLKALGVKTIDLYQLHFPNPLIPVAETMGAMEELVKDGKIRYIGVSNFSADEIAEAQAALKAEEIVSDQVEYSVFVRDSEQTVEPYCTKERLTVIAYSPFASGKMFGPEREQALGVLERIGAKYGKTGAQVALNWLMSKKAVIPIPKAGTLQHMRDNAGSVGFKLSRKDLDEIDGIGSSGIRPLTYRLNGLAKKGISLWSGVAQKTNELKPRHGI